MDLEQQFKKLRKASGIKQIAGLYIQCYLQGNHTYIRQLMDEEISYDVPNTGLLNANPQQSTATTGAKMVLDTFDSYRQKMENIRFDIRNQFLTKNTAYFDILLRYEQCGRFLCGAQDDQRYHLILPVNTVLTLNKNRIVRHHDYIDYSVIYRQIQSQTPVVA
jgi:hypothetical protein